MSNDKLEPMTSAGSRELPVPVWAVTILNLLFIAAGIYLVTLGGAVSIGAGLVLAIMGVSGLVSIGGGA